MNSLPAELLTIILRHAVECKRRQLSLPYAQNIASVCRLWLAITINIINANTYLDKIDCGTLRGISPTANVNFIYAAVKRRTQLWPPSRLHFEGSYHCNTVVLAAQIDLYQKGWEIMTHFYDNSAAATAVFAALYHSVAAYKAENNLGERLARSNTFLLYSACGHGGEIKSASPLYLATRRLGELRYMLGRPFSDPACYCSSCNCDCDDYPCACDGAAAAPISQDEYERRLTELFTGLNAGEAKFLRMIEHISEQPTELLADLSGWLPVFSVS